MRTNRPYVQIDPDVLERVRQIDLLSYLREFEPSNLVKVKGTSNVYCTAEHDSLKISNGKWYWWSRGFGGYSVLDYLIKVKEYDFVEAVEILTGQTMVDWKPPLLPRKMNRKSCSCRQRIRTVTEGYSIFSGVVLTISSYRSVYRLIDGSGVAFLSSRFQPADAAPDDGFAAAIVPVDSAEHFATFAETVSSFV